MKLTLDCETTIECFLATRYNLIFNVGISNLSIVEKDSITYIAG